MFLINSRLGHFTAPPNSSVRRNKHHHQKDPFSRSYGANLPSSLTRFLSRALVYSTLPPVSVYGTVTQYSTFRSFSWQYGINSIQSVRRLHVPSPFRIAPTDFPIGTPYGFRPPRPIGGWPSLLRHSITHTDWYRNIKPVSHRLRFSAST